jgi:hypothetical protein
MTEYDMYVKKHLRSQDAAKLPESTVVLESKDPKMRLRIKSPSTALFQEYPLGHPVTVRIEAYAQKKLSMETEA